MKRIRSIALYIILFFYFSSCQKEVTVKLPPLETKLVLRCFISPHNKKTQVNVSQTQPIYNNPNYSNNGVEVTDATVTISSNNGSWLLPYANSIEGYVIDTTQLKIREGVTYKLTVRTPDGKYAEAVTTVPVLTTTLTATATFDSSTTPYTKVDLSAHWQDPPNSKEYYEFTVETRSKGVQYGYIGIERIDDAVNSGGTITRNWYFNYYHSVNDTLFATLAAISPEYYEYFNRLYHYESPEGPFAESYPMYTNISGGFGVFAGFNKKFVLLLPQ